MSLPLLEYELLYQTPQAASFVMQEAFEFGGTSYLGTQASAWESSEVSWDQGDPAWGTGKQRDPERGYGRWHGPGAIQIRPGALWITGADSEHLGGDDLACVATGISLHATWQYANPGFVSADNGVWRVVLQDAATGTVVFNTTNTAGGTVGVDLPALSSHAVLWVRLEQALRNWSLPPDYLTVRGFTTVPERFQYVEDDQTYTWDYEADVGRRPADHATLSLTGDVLWDKYRALMQSGGLVHRGEWSQYISDGSFETQGGPWSALRIAVGSAPFAVGGGFLPYPGPALYQLNAGVSTAYAFDPLACSVSAFEVMRLGAKAGQARLGGTIATRNGPATAYWHFHPGTNSNATLLGTSMLNFVPICEASLYPTVADILELPDGTELILSYSYLYRYDSGATTIDTALPGVPAATQGHPGGRCLRTVDGTIKFFTEAFGGVGAPVGNDTFAQFYNTLRTLDPRQNVSSGNGTVFHSHNAAEVCWGRFYGWVQDKPFTDTDAQQFLAYQQAEKWVSAGLAGFPAASYRWQRARRVNGADGIALMLSGKNAPTFANEDTDAVTDNPDSEAARWGIANGTMFREASLPFRPRRLTRVTREDGTERLYCVGRFVSKGDDGVWLCSLQQSVIALTGGFRHVCTFWSDDLNGYTVEAAVAQAAGLDTAKLPAYLWWEADATLPAGGVWLQRASAPTDGRAFLIKTAQSGLIAYKPGTGVLLPYDVGVWSEVCFTVYDDGGSGNDALSPLPGCTDAQCVLDSMPPGSRYVVVRETVPANLEYDAIQISDAGDEEGTGENATGLRKLAAVMRAYPNLWLRVDSDAPPDDLATYTQRAQWNRFQSLPQSARQRVEVCALVPPSTFNMAGRVFAPVVEPHTVNQLPPTSSPNPLLEDDMDFDDNGIMGFDSGFPMDFDD